MSIAIGSKYRGEQETVEVFDVIDYRSRTKSISFETVIFIKNDIVHVLTKDDFLRQYKFYDPVYEYKFALGRDDIIKITDTFYKDDTELCNSLDVRGFLGGSFQRLDFTKRERT